MKQNPDPDRDDDLLTADEASASEARRRLRADGIIAIEPDQLIAPLLAPGEKVVAIRRAVSLERLLDFEASGEGVRGDLYVTTSRIVHMGKVSVEVPLPAIKEAVVAEGAVRLIVEDGRGVDIHTNDPSVLRVEIAAVREAVRRSARQTRTPRNTTQG